jgi:hypothetical protein
VSGNLPASEVALIREQPISNQPGSLPRYAALYGERVLYEAHPRPIGLHPVAFWVCFPLLLFFGLITLAGIADGQFAPAIAAGSVVLFVLPFAIVVAWVFTSARSITYALTDQRVILRTGDDLTGIPYDAVAKIEAHPKRDTIVITPALRPQGTELHRPFTAPVMTWRAVRRVSQVAWYANLASRFFVARARQPVTRPVPAPPYVEESITCEACGARIPVSNLNPAVPRCPRCSAPIRVAPSPF